MKKTKYFEILLVLLLNCFFANVKGQTACNYSVSINVTNASCFGCGNGVFLYSVAGNTAPYSATLTKVTNGEIVYKVGNLSNTNGIGCGSLFAGNYLFSITDNTGCKTDIAVTISEPNPVNKDCSDYKCGKKNEKILVCHLLDKGKKRQTLCIDANAIAQHLAHGDICGPCSVSGKNDGDFSEMTTEIVEEFVLENYPIPFDDKMTIRFISSKDDNITVNLFDLSGKQINTLFNRSVREGEDILIDFSDKTLTSGMYFYQVISGDNVYTRKIICQRN